MSLVQTMSICDMCEGDTQSEKGIVGDAEKGHAVLQGTVSSNHCVRLFSAGHMEEAGGLRGGPGGPEQQWPTVSSATTG